MKPKKVKIRTQNAKKVLIKDQVLKIRTLLEAVNKWQKILVQIWTLGKNLPLIVDKHSTLCGTAVLKRLEHQCKDCDQQLNIST